jgi:hypothetical protein
MNSGERFSQNYLSDVLLLLESAANMSLMAGAAVEDDADI